ncbi:MAG: hypothetical protein H6810_04920 [Phycisphaeraceae bacterium]|nr:MAG: hypothetical protein H6810_04920 [Phycisphaeraceae bacterium]
MKPSASICRPLAAVVVACTAGLAPGDIEVAVTSGNAPAGDPDALVTYFSFGDLASHEPGAADFAAALAGPAATVVDPDTINVGGGCWQRLEDPAWTGVNASYNLAGLSTLFAVAFDVPDMPLLGSTIHIEYTADNFLGGFPPVPGLYINEIPVPHSTDSFCPDGGHGYFFTTGSIDIDHAESYLSPNATNHLYLNIDDSNESCGVLFGMHLTIPTPCNAADLAPQFGVLDLVDINAFVDGFLASDPIADLNADGVFDLVDVNMFIDAFLNGCP